MLRNMADDLQRRRAETLLRRPGLLGARGATRQAVLALRAEAEAALADADQRLRRAAADRLTNAERIRACNRALSGTGTVTGSNGESILVALRPSGAFDDPRPDPSTLRTLSAKELRDALVDLLRILDRPTTIDELDRLLAAHRVRAGGRASQAISNALRAAVRDGTVHRVGRGCYRIAQRGMT
jgi:hypothetical protein